MESYKQNSRQYRISVFKSGLVKQSVDWGYRLLSPCNSTCSRAGEGWNGSNKKCWLAVKALAHGRRTNEGREMGKKLASETEASDRKVFWRQEPWPWNRRNQVKSGRGHSARWYFLPLRRRASGPRYTLATLLPPSPDIKEPASSQFPSFQRRFPPVKRCSTSSTPDSSKNKFPHSKIFHLFQNFGHQFIDSTFQILATYRGFLSVFGSSLSSVHSVFHFQQWNNRLKQIVYDLAR